MNTKIESGAPPAPGLGAPPVDRSAGTVTTGAFRGDAVVLVASPESLIQNAAEELTFALAERHDAKSLAERKLHPQSQTNAEAVEAVRQFQELIDRLADKEDPQKLQRLREQLRQAGPYEYVRDFAFRLFSPETYKGLFA